MLQGWSMDPILCLLLMNYLLTVRDNYNIFAYADNIVILMKATAYVHFREYSKEPLNLVEDWWKKYGLNFSLNKCNFTLFKRGKYITHIPAI